MIKIIRCQTVLEKGVPVRVEVFRCACPDGTDQADYFTRVLETGGTLESGICVINFLKYLQ